MRFILYNHVGSGNHGCEALVRTISHMLGENNTLLLSDFPDEEKQYGIDNLICVRDSQNERKKLSKDFVKAFVKLKLNKDYFPMDALTYNDALKKLERDDVLVSIGGDIYCYDNYPKYIQIHKKGLQYVENSILIGCSIEPNSLKDNKLLNDIKSYKFISAREHITYNALIDNGVKNVFYFPDTAFDLPAEESVLPKEFLIDRTVGLNVSPLVLNKSGNGDLLMDNYRRVIEYLIKKTDFNIALIPHVVWESNDDRIPLKKLYDEFFHTHRLCMIEDQSATCLKWIISKCNFFIGARTHATIAAYSTGIPTLVLGYSVKSKGIAQDLFGDAENYVLPFDKIRTEHDILDKFMWIMENRDRIESILNLKILEYHKLLSEMPLKIRKVLEDRG